MEVNKLLDMAKKARANVTDNRTLLEDADEYTNPFFNVWNGDKTTLNKPTKSYDSTPIISTNNFVNKLVTELTPPFVKWADLKAGPEIPEDAREEVDNDLEIINDKVFSYINSSNFATASAEMYYGLAVSTGCLFVLEGDEMQPLNFVSAPLAEMGFSEGNFGTIDFICREWNIKASLVKHTWKKAKITKAIQDEASDKDGKIKITETFNYDYTKFLWEYNVVSEVDKEIIYTSTSKHCPVVLVRWLKIPGFALGVGPVLMALADIKTLNKMKELSLKMAALNTFGVYTIVNNGVFNPNTAKITPGAFIPVQKNGGPDGPTISPLPNAGNLQSQEFMINDLKDQVRQILKDSGLPPEGQPIRSAYEIAERIKKFQSDTGASFGRIMYEYVVPMYRRVLEILSKKGLLELPSGFDIDNMFVKLQVTSPIAQTQSYNEVQRFAEGYQMLQMLDPMLAQVAFEKSELPSYIFDKLGATRKHLLDKEAIAEALANMPPMEVNNG